MTSVPSATGRPSLQNWPLVAGFAALALPTIVRLAQQDWSEESGAHGPIVLATGLWLLWRGWPDMRRTGREGSMALTAAALLITLPLYVFGRAYSFKAFEAVGVYAVGVIILYHLFGFRTILRHWFPLAYLGFAVPPPSWILDSVTAPLKEFVSFCATSLLQVFDLPVARHGVTIVVAQYQLLVEDACSGLNSLFGLIAIGLLYVYLMRGPSLFRTLALLAFIVPIAIAANIVRVIIIVLLTYFAGNDVAQSFVHFLAGLLLFGVSLSLVFLVDRLLAALLTRRSANGLAA